MVPPEMMRAPDFWRIDGVRARGLAPLGMAYGLAARLNYARGAPWRADVPVVCIGNLVMGGAGKTPVAAGVGAELVARGFAPHFLSRGHGGNLAGPILVQPGTHSAADVGDEPLILSPIAPTWVSRDRPAGAKAAQAAGADVIVMDDGFQNPSLAKDVSLLVFDAGYGLGNGRVFPSGPLREPARTGVARADAAILIGEDRVGIENELRGRLPLFRARYVPVPGAERIADKDVVAFAGIGRPEKFFATLAEMGCRVHAARSFADHHMYRDHEIMEMVDLAFAHGATLVTTTKDAVRLTPEMRSLVEVLEVTLEWEDADAPEIILAPVLDRLAQRRNA
jgi:tetraacyldisaccharide 4'-kinase